MGGGKQAEGTSWACLQEKLQFAKDQLRQKVSQWLQEHPEKLLHQKVHACVAKLKERFEGEGEDMRCIVFTRSACCLNGKLPSASTTVAGCWAKGVTVSILGAWKIRQTVSSQKQVLASFARSHEEGSVSIVVATSVLAEGIDIPSCGLVLCFDPAVSPLQHVQLRGRARAANSEFTVLVPANAAQCTLPARGPSLQQLKDYEDGVLRVLKGWQPRKAPLGGAETFSSDEVLVVPSTGARLPIEKAKQHLHTHVFGRLLPGETRDREMLDRWDIVVTFWDNEQKYGYSMFQVKQGEEGFACELELPPVGCCSKSLEEQWEAAKLLSHEWWKKKDAPLCKDPTV
eukprot:g3443.t1